MYVKYILQHRSLVPFCQKSVFTSVNRRKWGRTVKKEQGGRQGGCETGEQKVFPSYCHTKGSGAGVGGISFTLITLPGLSIAFPSSQWVVLNSFTPTGTWHEPCSL